MVDTRAVMSQITTASSCPSYSGGMEMLTLTRGDLLLEWPGSGWRV